MIFHLRPLLGWVERILTVPNDELLLRHRFIYMSGLTVIPVFYYQAPSTRKRGYSVCTVQWHVGGEGNSRFTFDFLFLQIHMLSNRGMAT